MPNALAMAKPGDEANVGVLAGQMADVEVETPPARSQEPDRRVVEEAVNLVDQCELDLLWIRVSVSASIRRSASAVSGDRSAEATAGEHQG
jgi:hypothetical protein